MRLVMASASLDHDRVGMKELSPMARRMIWRTLTAGAQSFIWRCDPCRSRRLAARIKFCEVAGAGHGQLSPLPIIHLGSGVNERKPAKIGRSDDAKASRLSDIAA